MAVKATAKGVGTSSKKLFPILNLIRGKQLQDAMSILQFLPSPAARQIAKVVKSAAANAENNLMMDPTSLKITSAFAGIGPSLRRMDPKPRGRAGIINKPSSHITIYVDEGKSNGT